MALQTLAHCATSSREPTQGGARCVALVFVFLASRAVVAQETGAQVAGEALYAPCAACHGAEGSGNAALGAPALAGQLEAYLARQLHNFRSGYRGGDGDSYGAQMTPFASQLEDDAAVEAVAAYIAALPPVASTDSASGDARRGASLYNGNCGACHGGRAEGNEALKAPRLAGLGSAYLKRQFTAYADGLRGSHPEDRPGRQMAMMAKTLAADGDLEDVVTYIQTLEIQGAAPTGAEGQP